MIDQDRVIKGGGSQNAVCTWFHLENYPWETGEAGMHEKLA